MMPMKRGNFIPPLALLLALVHPPTVTGQVDAFAVDTARVPVGRLYEYLKSNRDGTRPSMVSLYVAGPSRLESLKWAPRDTTASLVVAVMDWTRVSVRRLESWTLVRGAEPGLRASLDTDTSGFGVRVSFQPDSLLPIHRWPWHSYDFDFASLNVAFAFLREPERSFVFERADITYADAGPPFADLGEVEVRHRGTGSRSGIAVRHYELDGPGLSGHQGQLWVAVQGGHFVEYVFPFPDEPGYTDVRLQLRSMRRLTPAQWEAYKRERIGGPYR
jgi:hypothetical protein